MDLCLVSVTILFSFIFFWNPIHGSYIGDIAINCGYHGKSTALDGRQWFGDVGSRSGISMLQPGGKSTSSTADQPADPIPYMTARTSATEFYYTFQVNPGQKFIRLHFYPSSYRGFEKSIDFFTVKAGPFTLLRNFSASHAAEAMGVKCVIKEFCLNVEENKFLNLTFSASQSAKQRNVYAFVNGIEIISMPTGLYYTLDGDLGARMVGQGNRYYYIDNSTALEIVQRLNIGGSSISPAEDFGMFRRWTEDAKYLLELKSKLQPVNHLVPGINIGTYTLTTPIRICHTSWKTGKNGRADKMYNFTWKIPVDLGFGYFVRLHFCDFGLVVMEDGSMELNVLINNHITETNYNQIAETKADIIRFSGKTGVPIHRDYMVMVKGDEEVNKYDLCIALQSSNELAIGLLRGLEIFKLSNPDNNLATKNHVYLKQVSASSNLKIQNLLLAFDGKNVIVTGITVLLILLNLIVFKLRQIWEETCHEEKDTQSVSRKQSCHRFSLTEIISATQNFSNAFLIGRGGFGNVYKGFIHGGSEIVAVKRLQSNSKQGAHEFWTEIEALSSIRHKHLVSLIGYCNEYQEMVLVYEYMPHGTLADNLYKIGRNGKNGTSLTWEQRLRICIGAARGLDYLHTGIECEIIHRDVKDSNILLDKNLVAKISDFGLSKLGNESHGCLSTKVKGTPGFLDPDYYMTHKPTIKTDVYAFGMVMLVVLCGRPAIDMSIPWEPQRLLSLFRESMKKGDINDIVDLSIQGKISSESLKEFIKSIENCLHIEPKERPTMSQIVTSLEYALEMQQSIMCCKSEEVDASVSDQPCDDGIIQSINVAPPHQESHTSSPEEGIPGEVICNFLAPSRGQGLQAGRKHLLLWPRETLWKKRKNWKNTQSIFSRIRLSQIRKATNNFSRKQKLGEGGFGPVYKGVLPNGQEIAVKRLSRNSIQCPEQVEVEIKLLANLQHRNIVRLLGFCVEREENILVCEYVPNRSLDYFLFGQGEQYILDWSRRYEIITGIASGLLYLHEGSRLRLIHRDLKPSNVLLDAFMNPKIADFGLARILGPDQSQETTTGIVGTFGYMAPEYALHGKFSVKSDVFSFGVLILEIVTGKKISSFYQLDGDRNLLSYAWKLWIEGAALDLVDPALGNSYPKDEVIQCIHVGLLCVQEDFEQRPSTASVVDMLKNSADTLATPNQPAFFGRMEGTSRSTTGSENEVTISETYPS